ncbi:hypothetical protein C6500_05450 [Candidatus Poribacteria bacterium]|nr:MAG: hypothetical protein C6500_05450 [Candidatus Poribacteria bacterium]
MRHLRYMLIAVACVGMSLGVVFAQDNALEDGTVRGLITDLTPAQNPIEDVEVKIVAQDSGKAWTTKTDADGEYKQSGLPAGRYLIRISKEGYNERTGKPVTIVDGGDHFIPLKMSKNAKIKPSFIKPKRMSSVLKPRIESLRQRLSEDIGERYDLDAAAVNTLRLSIPESIETALEQDSRNILVFGKAAEGNNIALIKILLSHPVCKAAFTRHLSEAQLQDYLEFTKARQQRDRQAVAHWITVRLDQELSLRADQREKFVQSLLETAENELFPTSMNALQLSPQQSAQLMHYRLKVSLDGVLSEAQSKVWQGLVNANTNRERVFVVVPEAEIKNMVKGKELVFIPNEPDEHLGIEGEIEVVIDDIVIDQQGKQPWIEINADKSESPEHMREIAEAKLAAHTELLGTLDERATRRLALVAKGVVQQYFEAQDEAREAISREIEADLTKKVEDGKMTREEAAAMLEFTMRNAMDELSKDGGLKADITEHPLYQQAIKDVLSEEAFARYSEHQDEREVLRQQALRDMVVAGMDMQLLLDDMQRERLETAASQLIPGPLHESSSLTLMFFQLFPQTVDFEVLTPWQRTEFERVFGPIAWRR